MEFLKFFDPNGVNLNLRINRKNKVSSKESVIFYLIFIAFSLFYTFIQLFKYLIRYANQPQRSAYLGTMQLGILVDSLNHI